MRGAAGKGVVRALTETEPRFQEKVIELAQYLGWKVSHFRPARTAKGWRTPVQGDAGFVDLVLARRGRVLLVELKSDRGLLSRGQLEWKREIEPSGLHRVWRPGDWDDIEAELRGTHDR